MAGASPVLKFFYFASVEFETAHNADPKLDDDLEVKQRIGATTIFDFAAYRPELMIEGTLEKRIGHGEERFTMRPEGPQTGRAKKLRSLKIDQ